MPDLFRRPAVFARFPTITAAESLRHGGVSPEPFASLNLGLNTTDAPEHVAENRRRFFTALNVDEANVVSAQQVHGTEVLNATLPGRFDGYDAFMTNQPGLFLTVSVADCVPILIYDAQTRAVAAIHAGWRGTVGGIVAKTLAQMKQEFGTQAASCYAYVGTCIDETSFAVGEDVAAQFAVDFVRVDNFTGKAFVNLRSANVRQLTDAGVPAAQIGISTYSTVLDNDDYFSHRHEQGQTGRMLAVIGVGA